MCHLRRLLAVFVCFPLLALGQDSLRTDSYFRVDSENDLYHHPLTDHYYTNGLRLTLLSNYWHRWPTRYLLPTFHQLPGRRYDLLYEATLGQDLYTPHSINRARFNEAPVYYDRPFAGYLFAVFGLTVSDAAGGRKLTSQLTVGVIGPLSTGAETQMGLHHLIRDVQPVGWGKQIQNDPAISYMIRYEGRPLGRLARAFDLIGGLEGNVGTLSNYAGTSLLLRLGLFNDYFQNATGLYERNKPNQHPFQVYAFARPTLRAVLDNSLLTGGWFNHNREPYSLPFTELRHGYAQLEYGVTLAYKGFSGSYSIIWRGREYRTGEAQPWGRILLLWRW